MNESRAYLRNNILMLHKYLNTLPIEKDIHKIINEAITKIEKLNSEDFPDDIIGSFISSTDLLLTNFKAYISEDSNNESRFIASGSINNAIKEINETLYRFYDISRNDYNIFSTEEDLKSLNSAIKLSKELSKNYTQLDNKIHFLDKLATDRIKEIDTNFESKIRELKEQLGEIESSIAKKALSASFRDRAKKLETESNKWLLASFISIASLIVLAVVKLNKFPPIGDLNFDTLDLHLRASIIYLPICIALFWAIWFCTKRYTHLCHLRDEYNYKHDLSESFIGYKKEVTYLDNLSDSDLKLFPMLMSAVIQNICKSPLETNKEECHSPWSEIVSLACKKGKEKIDKE